MRLMAELMRVIFAVCATGLVGALAFFAIRFLTGLWISSERSGMRPAFEPYHLADDAAPGLRSVTP